MTNKAIKLMYDAHKNQLDKSGIPYVFHPWHVAESMKDEKRCTVALLHDVIEDTDITKDKLIEEGFPIVVVEAIDVLTKKENEDYQTYIRNISENELAIDVKIADLMHNMDKSRFVDENTITKIKYELYESSLNFLVRTKKMKEISQKIKR
jgi:(p)ppGpp synthase/HD superfamily hydrolase